MAEPDPRAQVSYFNQVASTYDEKWSISFDRRCIDYARGLFDTVVDGADAGSRPYARCLDVGGGTGFFSFNLALGGVLTDVHLIDVAPAMVAQALATAESLGLSASGSVADAEALPFPDDTFDLVVGHAVLHHVVDVEKALVECVRVLRPGGRLVFAGEPTPIGHWYARRLGRLTWAVTTGLLSRGPLGERFRRTDQSVGGRGPDQGHGADQGHTVPGSDGGHDPAHHDHDHQEARVDLHTFDPEQLTRLALRAGAVDVRTCTDELTAAFLGWPVRTVEAAARPGTLGSGWSSFAYGSWRRLSRVDKALGRVVPARFFYNVSVTGTKPGG